MSRAVIGCALLFGGAALGTIGLYAPMATLEPTIRLALMVAGFVATAAGVIVALTESAR